MTEYPKELTPALIEVLGMHPGMAIQIVGAMRASGWEIPPHYEEENAQVRHLLIPLAIEHGDNWREEAIYAMGSHRMRKAALDAGMAPDDAEAFTAAAVQVIREQPAAMSEMYERIVPHVSADLKRSLERLYGLRADG